MEQLYRVVKASEQKPPDNIIDTYHCNIRMKDMDESTFPQGVTFSGEWEIGPGYEVVEWLEPLPAIAEGDKEIEGEEPMIIEELRYACTAFYNWFRELNSLDVIEEFDEWIKTRHGASVLRMFTNYSTRAAEVKRENSELKEEIEKLKRKVSSLELQLALY